MRNVTKPSNIPNELIDSEAQTHFEHILAQKKVKESNCIVYRKAKQTLFDVYKGKCCYCESKLSGTEIEHYRPKSTYYWLVYAWDNLLPICSQCNKEKGRKFPISGKVATIGTIKTATETNGKLKEYNDSENPAFVNPEIDKIQDDTFTFDEKGVINSNEPRFSTTIQELKLNRPELLYHRKRLFDDLNLKIADIKADTKVKNEIEEHKNILLQLVKESQKSENDYIALRKYLIEHYRKYLITNIL